MQNGRKFASVFGSVCCQCRSNIGPILDHTRSYNLLISVISALFIKKLLNYLHISKKCSTFAAVFKR